MKRLLPLLIVIPLIFSGCVREPYADFYSSASVVNTYELIQFHNISDNYESVEWDFGDGTYSTNSNVTHLYTVPGIYTVTLTVYGPHNRVDKAYEDIRVLVPNATLEITVLEYEYEYPVANASVILYPTLDDWNNETNPITDGHGHILEGFTDSYGMVTFTGLDPITYYVDVWRDHYNNYILAEDDVNFIRTAPLANNAINTFTAYVDYFQSSSKKSARDLSKNMVIVQTRSFQDIQQSKQRLLK